MSMCTYNGDPQEMLSGLDFDLIEQRRNDPEYLRQVIQELKESYDQLQLEHKKNLEILRAIKKIEQQLIDQSLGKGRAFDIEQQAENNTKPSKRGFPVAAVAVSALMVVGFIWLAK